MRSAWITVAVLAASAFTIGAAEARPSHKGTSNNSAFHRRSNQIGCVDMGV
jgi:hypothetical protein